MIDGLSRTCSAKEFQYWANLRVDFVILSTAWDFFFDPSNPLRVINVRWTYGMNILFHPKPNVATMLSPANPSAQDQIILALRKFIDLIEVLSLIPQVNLHPGTFRIPGSTYPIFSEEETLYSSISFYQRLRYYSDVAFVLENTYPPGFGWKEIGYAPIHFEMIDPEGSFKFCLDTGHLDLSSYGLRDLLALPNKLTCVHLHSNDKMSDQHLPMTRSNFDKWDLLLSCLAEDIFAVIEVKQNTERVSRFLEDIRRGEIAIS